MVNVFLHRVQSILVLLPLVTISCGSATMSISNVDASADISALKLKAIQSCEDAETAVGKYSIDFEIPNPLVGASISVRRVDPSHENIIICRATLLDEVSTEADIMHHCFSDSLDEGECKSFREKYISENIREGMFRIRISMESGFSPKSMEPERWTMYLENARGIMIEPADITTSAVSSNKDSVYSEFYRINLPRRLLKRDITLYFKRTTFFGEDLLGSGNPYIVLVVTRVKKTFARIAWKTSEITKR